MFVVRPCDASVTLLESCTIAVGESTPSAPFTINLLLMILARVLLAQVKHCLLAITHVDIFYCPRVDIILAVIVKSMMNIIIMVLRVKDAMAAAAIICFLQFQVIGEKRTSHTMPIEDEADALLSTRDVHIKKGRVVSGAFM
jgi:hypothetical protein